METWYATTDLLLCLESLDNNSSCPLTDNRQGDEASGACAYQRVDALDGSTNDLAHGTRITITGFPKDHKVPRFRVEVSPHRTDDVVPNDQAQDATAATHEVGGFRWKIAPWHRAGTQGTGLERCQGRKARLQRPHSGCALLGWVRLKELAAQTGRTV